MNIPWHARDLTFSCFHDGRFLASERACRWLIEAIERARAKHVFRLWAWVIMPEHAHVLIWPQFERPDVGPVQTSIKKSVTNRALRWVSVHAPQFMARMADTGPSGEVVHRFWQRGGGHDRNVWSPDAIWNTVEYIHMNPVRRGLCAAPEDWAWSSAREWLEPGAGPLRLDRESIPPRPA